MVIPARYASQRLPGKVLATIVGKPMIQHVWHRAVAADIGRVIVATDSAQVADVARSFGAEVAMTSDHHGSGTERTAEVAASAEEELILNVQADEPLIRPSSLSLAVSALRQAPDAHLSTLARPLRHERALADPSVVKVTTDDQAYATDFFRQVAGNQLEAMEHIGVYCYRRFTVLFLARQAPTARELQLRLEQLRALHMGLRVRVAVTDDPCVGVNTPEELEVVRRIMEAQDGSDQRSNPGNR